MARKNNEGKRYAGWKSWEQKLVEGIDRREENGTNRENVDDTFNNYHFTTEGAREWSF